MTTKLLLILSIVLSPLFATASGSGQPDVQWRFDTSRDADDNPMTAVSLVIGSQVVAIAPKTPANFRTIKRESYRERGVPAEALTACSGWWAGEGNEYYVIRDGRKLAVYHRGLSESAAIPRFKLLRRISVPVSK